MICLYGNYHATVKMAAAQPIRSTKHIRPPHVYTSKLSVSFFDLSHNQSLQNTKQFMST